MEIKEAYKQKMAAQLKEWNAQISLLEAKVEKANGEAWEQVKETVENIG